MSNYELNVSGSPYLANSLSLKPSATHLTPCRLHPERFSFTLSLTFMTLLQALLMFAAAFFAGVVNSIAGGGTLLTFPVLIWLGLDPKVANATSTVALWPGLFGGTFGYRREMNDSSLILMRLGVISVIGGGVGAWLLIATPSPTFARLVPFLILFATILFMIQGPVNRWLRMPEASGYSAKPGGRSA